MLEARGISLTLGHRRALDDVSVTVARGELVVVAGPNGAGKSSLVDCLSGARRADAGEVRLDGMPLAAFDAAALARRRAVLEQGSAVAAPFTVAELVALPIPREIGPADAGRLVADALGEVGLAGFGPRRVHETSGGEQLRAHMARALAQLRAGQALGGGSYLMLDEPTASLDLCHQAGVLEAARRVAEEGAGVLAVLHDLTLAAAFADRIVLMNRGRVAAEGAPWSVLTEVRIEEVYGLPVSIGSTGGALSVVPRYRDAPPSHRIRTARGDQQCS